MQHRDKPGQPRRLGILPPNNPRSDSSCHEYQQLVEQLKQMTNGVSDSPLSAVATATAQREESRKHVSELMRRQSMAVLAVTYDRSIKLVLESRQILNRFVAHSSPVIRTQRTYHMKDETQLPANGVPSKPQAGNDVRLGR